MKRSALVLGLLLVGSLLPGCPIYTSDDGCVVDSECDHGYVCDGVLGLCRPESDLSCSSPSDCGGNATCSRSGSCVVGDCSWPDIGCVAGYVCSKVSGAFACVESGGSGGTSGAGGADNGQSAGAGDNGQSAGVGGQ